MFIMEREPKGGVEVQLGGDITAVSIQNTDQQLHFAVNSSQDNYLENRLVREASEVDVLAALKHSITRHRARARQRR